MRRLATFVAAAALVAACAHIIDPPPGGPDRRTPPKLIGTLPESLEATPGFRGNAEFRFDEIINEASPSFGRGTGDLEKHVLLSPDTAVPRVEWRRDRLAIRPRAGWRPNMVYWIDLLPGIADLHNNSSKTPYHLTVITGDSVPTRSISGRVINWSSRSGASGALVIAMHLPDSLRYRSLADSNGRFHLAPLPYGDYLVEGVLDQNSDHKRDGQEPWDTVRAAAPRDSVGEIWIFQRDSLPPKVQDIARTDSVTLTITLTMPIDPTQQFVADSIRVLLLPDSVTIGPQQGWAKALYDTLFKPIVKAPPPPKTAADSLKVTTDSIAAANRAATAASAAARNGPPKHPPDLPQQKRLALGNGIVVRTRGLLVPGSKYYVEVRGVRMAGGTIGTAHGRLDPPKPPPVDSTKVRADKARADSLHADSVRAGTARPDSTGPAKPDSVRRPR